MFVKLERWMDKKLLATHYNFTASVICSILTFGLFLCRPNVQTHREGLLQLNVFLQNPEYSLTTRLAVHPKFLTRLHWFRAEMSVYDSGDKGSFVLLGDAGTEHTRRQASDNYLEANGELVGEEEVPTPQCLVDASGQTHKFRVEDMPCSFTSKRQAIMRVTKVVCPAVLPPRKPTVDNPSQALDVGHYLSPVSVAANSMKVQEAWEGLLVRQIHQPRRGRGTQRRKTDILGVAPKTSLPPRTH
ncbi:hypothetical protein Bca4012_083486 [Brassica carinata]|uniref:Uncharacterized protein n=1 Tax=Brassica carinata TaxID=52824 RepID=A0A8X7SLJ8_BRACI|nr:hypothetical protein Bca52824_027242 [Brassica carinata]